MAILPSYVRILFDGYQQNRESALLRTEMESGPPRQARVKSLVMTTRTAKLYLSTRADYLSFLTWYRDDIAEGALFFTMTDPVTATNIQARFVDGGFDSKPMSAKMDCWEIDVRIESWG